MRLTWRKQPDETGLAQVCQKARGAILSADGVEVARVGATRGDAWHWYARDESRGIPWRNSAAEGTRYPLGPEGLEAAKADCRRYVEECLRQRKQQEAPCSR